jgi:FMN-dependent NADH-azoreductase
MKKIILVYTFICLFYSAHAQVAWYQQEVKAEAHDPTMIRDNRGIYTYLSTNNLLSLRQSPDGINWTSQGRIFSSVPAWMSTSVGDQIGDIWAPQITFRNGLYWVYYCGSSFGTNSSVIGLVTSPTLDVTSPQYKWTDQGEVFKSAKGDNYNAIDPDLIVDLQGKCWLSFGSFWSGIKMLAIDPSTGKRLASDQTIYSIASRGGGAVEGPTIIAHNGYYYLFTSWDKCCAGISSTYRTMVGRSQTITGPYVDRQGRSLLNNFAEQELASYGRYIGPGGGSAFNNGKRSYYTHHYYNGEENGADRLQTREIIWSDDNWPFVTQPFLGRRASFEAEHAIMTDASLLTATPTTASNDEYVSLINADSKLTFYVNALQEGNYSLRIRYASPTAATHLVTLNTNVAVVLSYPSTNNSNTFPATQIVSMDVSLKNGTNVIIFSKGSNTISIDRIDLIRSATMTINTNAYEDAKNVFYLTPDSEGVSIATNGWMLFENVDFGTGGNNAINFLFSGNSSGDLVVSADALNGTVTQTYSVNVSNNPLNKSFTTSTAISNLKGIHDVYVAFKNNTTNGLLKSFSFSSGSINQLPTVSITSPVNNATFTAPANITIAANAADADGTVSSVQFFNGTTLLGTSTKSPYIFTWTNVIAGTYTITAKATDNNGAVTTSTAIAVQVLPVAPTVTATATYCQNATASQLTATGTALKWYTAATGGTASTTAPTPATTNVGTTNYYVSQTQNGSESNRAMIAVTVNTLPVITPYAQVDAGTWNQNSSSTVCAASTIALGPQPTVATGWNWTGPNGYTSTNRGITIATVTTTQAGNYTATYTDANGCKASSVYVITVNAAPTATISAGGATSFCTGSSVVLTASAGSSYIWKNGTTQVGTSASYTATTAGSYTVEVTNAGGCKATSTTTTVTINATPTATITASGTTSFCTGGSVVLTASAGSSYKWMNGTTQVGTSSSYTATTAGSYTVEVTNAGGCKATSTTTTVTINATPTATITAGETTTFCTGGSVVLTASAGSSYIWKNGTTQVGTSVTYTATTAGSYTVEVTNAGGCKATSTATIVTVNSPATSTINASGATTFCTGGSVVLTASAGSSYKWMNGTTQVGTTAATYTATAAGAYTVEVTNASVCSATSTAITVTVNAAPTATITANGPTNIPQGGSVVLTASAGSSYKWFNGTAQVGTGASYTSTTVGAYTVEVTNASGCKATSAATTVNFNTNQPSTITITSPTANATIDGIITITATATDPDGSIVLVEYLDGNTVIGTSTTQPYSFDWTNPGTGNHVITVRVTDSNGGITTSAPVKITSQAISTGVFSTSNSNSLNGTVYPNPANGIVFIDSDSDLSDAKFMLVDVLGNERGVNHTGNGTGATIDLSNLSAGTYVLISRPLKSHFFQSSE